MLVLVRKNQNGFTLIELMVALVVLGVLVSIAVPNFRAFMVNTQIRTTAESIRNGLQVARAEAIKRNEVVRFTLSSDTSWIVGCPTVTVNCPATIEAKSAKEGASSATTLTLTGANNISFTNLGTVTAAVGQLTQVDIDDSSISATETKELRITIGAGGNARMCDPNVSSTTDSRHC
jgi:type IV fimbrial biogenesis protein FimT